MKKQKIPDLEKYLEGKKRRFVNYTQGAKIYRISVIKGRGTKSLSALNEQSTFF